MGGRVERVRDRQQGDTMTDPRTGGTVDRHTPQLIAQASDGLQQHAGLYKARVLGADREVKVCIGHNQAADAALRHRARTGEG